MHFNLYLDDDTGKRITNAAKKSGASRNALIRHAVSDWLTESTKPGWPDAVLAFEGMAAMPPFEASRKKLKPPANDPLA